MNKRTCHKQARLVLYYIQVYGVYLSAVEVAVYQLEHLLLIAIDVCT